MSFNKVFQGIVLAGLAIVMIPSAMAQKMVAPAAKLQLTAAHKADVKRIEAALAKAFQGAKPDSVRPSPINGVYEVVYGPKIYYISADGRFLLNGSIYDLNTRVNITARRTAAVRSKAFDKLGEKNMIVFRAPHQKHVITVFTDIDCPYCRLMHSKIDKYLKEGITVRYLLFPRAGVNSESYRKAVSVWCARDKNRAFTQAKAGQPVKPRTCANPVRRHMLMGKMMNVTGTPTIIREDGKTIPGYVPPRQLKRILEGKESMGDTGQ